jgi:hypothetical protein
MATIPAGFRDARAGSGAKDRGTRRSGAVVRKRLGLYKLNFSLTHIF